ncbi:hypothetical protein HJD18_16525 [Thermoleophilia bacterium SCSIO 60948]|nr:hypothetical protein HJD18_16525 [Thermoleophilia bacterium SCSIO 60948]
MNSDIAVHIDNGRDTTLLTPSHTIGVVAVHGMLLGALLAVALYPQEARSGLRVCGWQCPYGAVFALVAGLFTLIGFPFDFAWHSLFGEDVTLWGPSHLQLIGGGALSVLGFVILACEARRSPGWQPTLPGRLLMACGIVAGPTVMSVFLGEFDFGIPQFQLVLLPAMIAFITGATLVFARIALGPTGALRAVAVWIVLRGLVFLGVAALGLSAPHFYPYLVEGLIVEAAFLVLGRRPIRAALLSGVLIGTVGCVATFGFSRMWGYDVLPWHLLPQALALATLAALSAVVLAVAMARVLVPDRVPAGGPPTITIVAAVAAGVVAFTLPLPRTGEKAYVADIDVQRVGDGSHVTVAAHFDDPSALDGAEWFQVFAWQGGGRIQKPMRYVGDGTWVAPQPIPITGEWKSMLRINDGSSMRGAPIRFNFDSFVGAPPIAARSRPDFAFQREQQYLMREYRGGRRDLILPGYLVHLATWLAFVAFAVFVLRRFAAGNPRPAAAA